MLQPHPAIFFICDMLRFVIENNRIFNSNLLKWALSQLVPEDFKSQFAKMLKMIMDTYEINFQEIYQFLMQRGIELSSDLFDTYTILPVREAIKNLLKDDDNIDVNDNDDD